MTTAKTEEPDYNPGHLACKNCGQLKAENERLRAAIEAVIPFEQSFRCEGQKVDYRNAAYTALANLRAALSRQTEGK